MLLLDDKNRVILDIDTEGSDYINASFIDVSLCEILLSTLWAKGILLSGTLYFSSFTCCFLGLHSQEGIYCYAGSQAGECHGLLAHGVAAQCARNCAGYTIPRGQHGN